jgi:hypothetical protein
MEVMEVMEVIEVVDVMCHIITLEAFEQSDSCVMCFSGGW